MRSAVMLVLLGMLVFGRAQAGDSYVLPDGVNRSPAVTLHCVAPNGVAVPCGTVSSPLVVTAPAGGPSASGQQAQLGAEQSSAQALGSTSDNPFSGGQGSVIAVLKSLWSSANAGVPALPVAGTLVSHSGALLSQTSTIVFPANPARRYLSFQVPTTGGAWINLMGGTAQPNGQDCAYFGPGTFYESGQFINRGAIAVYVSAGGVFSAWEY